MPKKDLRSAKICISLSPAVKKEVDRICAQEMKRTGKHYPFSTAISDIVMEKLRK